MEWSRQAYRRQYDNWAPWLEDQYLYYFGKGDNKASYIAKDNLSKSKVTGISQVDKLQDNINDTAAGQLGRDGLAAPLGDAASREGVNRAERGGKDDRGGFLPNNMSMGSSGGKEGGYVDSAKGAAGSVVSGAKSMWPSSSSSDKK